MLDFMRLHCIVLLEELGLFCSILRCSHWRIFILRVIGTNMVHRLST